MLGSHGTPPTLHCSPALWTTAAKRPALEVDPIFAREQYQRFREHFIVTRLGVPGIREFPAGREGSGDVDPGPLLWGVSASATVVSIGAARVHGDISTAGALAGVAEAFGAPLRVGSTKRYGLGLLPVGDAFIAWSRAARPYIAAPGSTETPARVISPAWRLPMHAIGAVVLVLAWWRRRKPGQADSPA